MFTLLKTAWRFVLENDFATIWRTLISRDAHPLLQFAKYGFCGVSAMIVHQTIWAACSTWLYPALDNSIPQETRALNSTINNGIAFCFSNVFAYLTNVAWVFTPGRHNRWKEFFYFTLAGTVGFVAGLTAGPYLIHQYGINSIAAQGSLVVASVLVNFVCRKFFVFKG